MLKEARKQSTDDLQENLRESKSLVNKEISALISDVINFKKLLNGWPNKFVNEKSSIKESIKGFPSGILEGIVNDFSSIASKCNTIIEQQGEYSKVRRKKQQKIAPSETQNTNTLQTALTANYDYSLESLGSNVASRFFSRLMSPGIGSSEESRTNRYRSSLLKALTDLEKVCSLLEQEIVKSSPESIFASIKMLEKIENNWIFINTGINTYANLSEKKVTDSEIEISNEKANTEQNSEKIIKQPQLKKEVLKTEFDQAVFAVRDFKHNISKCEEFIPVNRELIEDFAKVCKDFSWATTNDKLSLVTNLLHQYDILITTINGFYHTHENSIKNIMSSYLAEVKKQDSEEVKKEKVKEKVKEKLNPYMRPGFKSESQNIVSKTLGKLRHQTFSGKTSAIRLDIYKLLQEIRVFIDSMMSSLEKSMNIPELIDISKNITEKLLLVKEASRILNSTIRGTSHDKSFMSLLDKDLITDSPVDLDQKQRERLQRSIELKHIRDLSNQYKK